MGTLAVLKVQFCTSSPYLFMAFMIEENNKAPRPRIRALTVSQRQVCFSQSVRFIASLCVKIMTCFQTESALTCKSYFYLLINGMRMCHSMVAPLGVHLFAEVLLPSHKAWASRHKAESKFAQREMLLPSEHFWFLICFSSVQESVQESFTSFQD